MLLGMSTKALYFLLAFYTLILYHSELKYDIILYNKKINKLVNHIFYEFCVLICFLLKIVLTQFNLYENIAGVELYL